VVSVRTASATPPPTVESGQSVSVLDFQGGMLSLRYLFHEKYFYTYFAIQHVFC